MEDQESAIFLPALSNPSSHDITIIVDSTDGTAIGKVAITFMLTIILCVSNLNYIRTYILYHTSILSCLFPCFLITERSSYSHTYQSIYVNGLYVPMGNGLFSHTYIVLLSLLIHK